MSESGGLCRWCVGFLFTLGLTAFFLWLSYRPIHPRYFVVAFQVSHAADRTPTAASGRNTTVGFTLEIENKNKQMGVLHDAIAVSLSYGNRSGPVVTIPAFYQGHDKTADKTESADAGWLPRGVASPGTAVFRVGVETGYRYKVLLWRGRHHWVKVRADVEVDGEGKKKAKKGIRLRASGAQLPSGPRRALALVIAVVVMVAVVIPPPLMLFS